MTSDVDAVKAKLAEHSGKTIPVSSPMGTYFEYCIGCSEPRKNPSVDQRGLVGITDCPVQPLIAALEAVLGLCSRDGYTTWDTSMVPLVDGEYDPAETKKWELAHGHDIRLKCYPEFGCQLLIDPEGLLTEIAKELLR